MMSPCRSGSVACDLVASPTALPAGTHEHHKHEQQGMGGNVGGGVDTPDESIGQKIKSELLVPCPSAWRVCRPVT